MKKVVIVVLLIIGVIFFYPKVEKMLKKEQEEKFLYEDLLMTINDKKVDVNYYIIYGKYFNIKGNLPMNGDYTLVLKNNEQEQEVKTIIKDNEFYLADRINDGLNLEKLAVGEYLLLLKNKETNEYFNLINKTEYHDNKYYTITKEKNNNLITFNEEEFKNIHYWLIKVEKKDLPENVYDIVIDPGHGGIDTGAGKNEHYESKYTLAYAKALKEELERIGLKVKLTRETDTNIDHYGEGSRTGIPYEVKAKLMLSLHFNSSNSANQRGVEIYRAYNTTNDFAKVLADNIHQEVGINYSNNPQNKIIDGVYMRVYSPSDLASLKQDAIKKNYEPYVLNDHTTYYYFIREVGGIITGAFSDGRNPRYKANPYRHYNQGTEAYLCELAYISQNDDIKLIANKKDLYVKALKNSIESYLDKEEKEHN